MMNADQRAEHIASLQKEWTDVYVRANLDQPVLRRFGERVGRVVTVNWNGRAVIDFGDGAWYDVPADTAHLRKVDPAEGQKLFDTKNTSAVARPDRGG